MNVRSSLKKHLHVIHPREKAGLTIYLDSKDTCRPPLCVSTTKIIMASRQ